MEKVSRDRIRVFEVEIPGVAIGKKSFVVVDTADDESAKSDAVRQYVERAGIDKPQVREMASDSREFDIQLHHWRAVKANEEAQAVAAAERERQAAETEAAN